MLKKEILNQLLYKMLSIRRFEEKIVEVYGSQDMKTPVHLYIGEEAIASAVCVNLKKEDYIFTTHRSHGHCLAKGVDPKILYAEFYGRKTGCCKGKGGSMHPAFPDFGIMGTSAIVGGGIGHAVGTALASKFKNDNKVSISFFGDGAAEEGIFHESLNFASLKKLPVVFVCENNSYATNSHISARQVNDNIVKKAFGYDIPGVQVDGNDVLEVYRVATDAIERARSGGGPTLLECKTFRWKGHVGPDYIDNKDDLEKWMKKCPIKSYKQYLMDNNIINESDYQTMLEQLDSQFDSALRWAKESPFPHEKELYDDLYFNNQSEATGRRHPAKDRTSESREATGCRHPAKDRTSESREATGRRHPAEDRTSESRKRN